jgi:hypothetical protein
MITAVHFHDEFDRGSDEVSDVAAQGNLTTEGNTELAAREQSPESGFRRSRARTEHRSALGEGGLKFWIAFARCRPDELPSPPKRAGYAGTGAGCVPSEGVTACLERACGLGTTSHRRHRLARTLRRLAEADRDEGKGMTPPS